MRLAVIHLTRMQRGTVCVAGLDVATGEHVRPVLPMVVLPARVTAPHGGPFDMATVVDLGTVRPVPQRPELEDHEFTQWHARADAAIDPALMWDMLTVKAERSLGALFGPGLRYLGHPRSKRAVLDVGTGSASLGVLAPQRQPTLRLSRKPDGREVVRMAFTDGDMSLDLSVTDLRMYADDGGRPDRERIHDVATRLSRGVGVYLSVGLTRPFATRAGETPVHWLQVNNLHLEDDPCWRLARPARRSSGRELVGANAGGRRDTALPLPDDELPF